MPAALASAWGVQITARLEVAIMVQGLSLLAIGRIIVSKARYMPSTEHLLNTAILIPAIAEAHPVTLRQLRNVRILGEHMSRLTAELNFVIIGGRKSAIPVLFRASYQSLILKKPN
jgi:hypothetical protein